MKAGQQSSQHNFHLRQGKAVANAHEGASAERKEGVRVIVLEESLWFEAVWVRPVFWQPETKAFKISTTKKEKAEKAGNNVMAPKKSEKWEHFLTLSKMDNALVSRYKTMFGQHSWGVWDSSVGRALDSGSNGCEFSCQLEQQEKTQIVHPAG